MKAKQPLAHFPPPSGWGRELEKKKFKSMGWDKDRLKRQKLRRK